MTRAEYMNCLAGKLKRLPKEDFDQAMEYFQEYFEEAGAENEEMAIEDLGAPEIAADNIIMNLAVKNAEEPEKGIKKGLSAVWIGVLALFAAPIGVPMALAAAAVALSLIVCVLAVIFAVFVTAAAFVIASVVGCLGSIYFLITEPVNGITLLGGSLLTLGISIFIVLASIKVWRWSIKSFTKLFGKIAKGGRRHEKK